MITKRPQSDLTRSLKRGFKAILVVEAALLLGSYGFWRRLNTSQDFRYYMHQNFPLLLEGYYTIGESLSGNNHLRMFDLKTWTEEGDEQ